MGLVKPRKGSLAKHALSEADLDNPHYSPKVPIRRLEDDRLIYVNALIHAEMTEQVQLEKRIDELTTLLNETERERYAQSRARYESKLERLQQWTRLGLPERITMLRIPPVAKYGVIIALTALDFYVFAEAVAIATDTPASLNNARFVIGGVFGMVMAVLGFFFGRVLKNWSVLPAQRSLGRALRGSDPSIVLPVTSNTGLAAPLVLGLSFALALTAGAVVRLQANVEPNIGLLVFQILLPLAVAVIEFLLHDPLDLKSPTRTRKHQKMEKQLTNLSVAQSRINERYSQRLSTTNSVYAIEFATLREILQDHAIYVDDAIEREAKLEARTELDKQNQDAENQRSTIMTVMEIGGGTAIGATSKTLAQSYTTNRNALASTEAPLETSPEPNSTHPDSVRETDGDAAGIVDLTEVPPFVVDRVETGPISPGQVEADGSLNTGSFGSAEPQTSGSPPVFGGQGVPESDKP